MLTPTSFSASPMEPRVVPSSSVSPSWRSPSLAYMVFT
nr:MAG TPA: hypothetical protein [Bacteriophage sp.]